MRPNSDIEVRLSTTPPLDKCSGAAYSAKREGPVSSAGFSSRTKMTNLKKSLPGFLYGKNN
jgi:hypothetical protein